ncbi:MAG: bifunctional riboflavin kinase/FAD synthetase [Syntrophales bacterium]|nr:bifunctional riboflavin kinase/FAD synthetase [Syntrophales bacterium]
MEVISGWENIPPSLKGAYLTIGNFDGVHLGHQFIFEKLRREAAEHKVPSVVITFEPHPKMIIHPEIRPFYLITTLEEKLNLIGEHGINCCVVIPFDPSFAQTTAGEFVKKILVEKLHVKKVFIGHDYTFGRGKEGNETFLIEQGKILGFEVEVLTPFTLNGIVISSTRVRKAILSGEMHQAAQYLGRPYNLKGVVVEGHGRGQELGFPTANIAPEKVLIPPDGVYAVKVKMDHTWLKGAMNIGTNPTFGDEKRTLEVFLLDFEGNIYGRRVDVYFVDRIREERKFPSIDELINQITLDVARVREILAKSE